MKIQKVGHQKKLEKVRTFFSTQNRKKILLADRSQNRILNFHQLIRMFGRGDKYCRCLGHIVRLKGFALIQWIVGLLGFHLMPGRNFGLCKPPFFLSEKFKIENIIFNYEYLFFCKKIGFYYFLRLQQVALKKEFIWLK